MHTGQYNNHYYNCLRAFATPSLRHGDVTVTNWTPSSIVWIVQRILRQFFKTQRVCQKTLTVTPTDFMSSVSCAELHFK